LIKSKAAPGQTEEAKELLVKLIARARALGRDVRVLQGLDAEARDTMIVLQKHESLEHQKQMEQKIRNDPEWQKIRAKLEDPSFWVEDSVQSEVFQEVG
jgi:hypothetical protein